MSARRPSSLSMYRVAFTATAAVAAVSTCIPMAVASESEVLDSYQRLLATTTTTTAPSASSSTAHSVPFGTMANAGDTFVHILGFLVILAAAHPLGLLFPRLFRLPLITGYLLVGILTGPFVTNLVTNDTVGLLSKAVNAMALSFISFQAGQEIYLPELKPQIQGILKLLVVLYGTAMVLLTLVLWLGAGPFFYGTFDSSCKLAIALMFGSIAVLGSPATVMAIKIELDSTGPFTNLMLGATMTAEFVVLISFSVSRVVASVYCAKLDISFANLLFTMGIVFSNILVGLAIGLLIIAVFLIPGGPDHGHDHRNDIRDETAILGGSSIQSTDNQQAHSGSNAAARQDSFVSSCFGSLYFKGFVWLFLGYLFYISTTTISELTIAAYGHSWDVKFEPLLVLMVGSCLAGHHATIRHDMHVILDAAAPFVFLPFFVMTGAGLKLDQVADAIPLMSLFVGLRYVAIFVACYVTGRFMLKLPPKQYNSLWLTMTPQAGVALGLANEVKSLSTDPWAAEFAATIVAAVVVNQIVGPVLCSMGLNKAGESLAARKNAENDDLENGGDQGGGSLYNDPRPLSMIGHGNGLLNPALFKVSNAVVVGNDDAACEIALQLALHGAQVKIPLLAEEKAARWQIVMQLIAQGSHALKQQQGGKLNGMMTPNNVIELDRIMKEKPQHNNNDQQQQQQDEDVAIRQTLSAATAPGSTIDALFFTGDARRTLEHIKMLTATAMGSVKLPRLVAIGDDLTVIEELKRFGVLVVQPSLALANVATRIGLSDAHTASQLSSNNCPPEVTSSAALLLEPTGATASSVHRVLRDRRRVLGRNLRQVSNFQLVNHDGLREALGMVQLPASTNVAPHRISMFGRSSAVNGPEYFLGSTTMRPYRQSNLTGRGDIYVMGEDDSGNENGPGSPGGADVLGASAAYGGVDSSRSAKGAYVGTNLTPGNHRRGGWY
ncbi:hypothetical protein Gpo141_00009729 [Globisporangium polare]